MTNSTAAPAADPNAADPTADYQAIEAQVLGARTSFYWAMRLLPAEKRQAMFAVYAFCRAVDDVADEAGSAEAKRAGLAAWATEIVALYRGAQRGQSAHVIARALVAPIRDFGLAEADFLAVIEGCRMDAEGPIQAPEMATLRLYCARVAGAVGRLCVRIFGAPEREGAALAEALGEAVQLTNLLRDLDEDAAIGRLYLPRELLLAEGVPLTPVEALAHPHLPRVAATLMEMAARRFAEADAILAELSGRDLRPARIIAAIYRRLHEKLARRGFVDRRPIRFAKSEKLLLALRCFLFGR